MKASILLFGLALGLGACGGSEPVTEEANGIGGGADVETLPPDESVATPSDDLANGAVDPIANGNTAVENATP